MHIKFIPSQSYSNLDSKKIELLLSKQLQKLPLEEREFEKRIFNLKKFVEVV